MLYGIIDVPQLTRPLTMYGLVSVIPNYSTSLDEPESSVPWTSKSSKFVAFLKSMSL